MALVKLKRNLTRTPIPGIDLHTTLRTFARGLHCASVMAVPRILSSLNELVVSSLARRSPLLFQLGSIHEPPGLVFGSCRLLLAGKRRLRLEIRRRESAEREKPSRQSSAELRFSGG
jgi:hypothetical protein